MFKRIITKLILSYIFSIPAVENGYINHIENLYADNKVLLQTLKDELLIKNNQIETLMRQVTTKPNS